jgi:hypothetical protein
MDWQTRQFMKGSPHQFPFEMNDGQHGKFAAAIGHRTPFPKSAESTVVSEDGSEEAQHPDTLQASASAQVRFHRGRLPRQNHISAMPRCIQMLNQVQSYRCVVLPGDCKSVRRWSQSCKAPIRGS